MTQGCKSKSFVYAAVLAFVLVVFAGTFLAVRAGSTAAAAGASGYHLIKTIPIPGDTFWDYMKFQPSTRRLFVSHGTNVAVVNVDTGKIVGEIGGMTGIRGIVLAPEFNRGFVTDGQAAKVWIFDLKTLKVTGSTPAEPDADGEVYDPVSKRVFTMNGDSQSSTVLDAATGKVVGLSTWRQSRNFPLPMAGAILREYRKHQRNHRDRLGHSEDHASVFASARRAS